MASIYDPQDPDKERREALEYARLDPNAQAAFQSAQAQQLINKGMGNMARGVLGMPTGDRRAQAAEEIKALAQQHRPGTVEFYAAASDIFRRHGLVAEAEKMELLRNELEAGKGESQSEVMKLQRTRDLLQKRLDAGETAVEGAIKAVDRKLASLGVIREGTQPAEPELVKLQKARDAARAAGDEARAVEIQKAIDALLAKGQKQPDPIAAERLELAKKKDKRDQDKADAKVEADEKKTVSAITGFVRLIDGQLQAAQRLLVHPGLSWITGARAGLAGRGAAALSDQAAGAHALLLNVQANVFIKALQDLKATSQTGASGLGQLTEREGDKIQNAKAALDPQQPTAQFKRTLQSYIDELQSGRATAASELQGVGAPVPAAPPVISDVSRPKINREGTSLAARKSAPATEAPKPAATGGWSATKRSN
jgi:hypothetical protein